MKVSRNTLFFGDYPGTGEYLVYQTRTQSVININQQVKDLIDRATNSKSRKQGLGFSAEEKDVLNTLKEQGIIIENDADESKVLEHWFNQIKYGGKSLRLTVLTTYRCNFACPYCFEERVKQPKTMDTATASQVIEWITRKADEKQPKSLRVMFYGGEPLINSKAIVQVAKALNKWSAAKGIRFNFGMITNGALVKKGMVNRLKKLGLSGIRVTLDGDREHHNRRRPFLGGRGSFDTIIKNLTEVADLVKIDISHNVDKGNLDSFPALYDYLEHCGLSGKINSVSFGPVVARFGEDGKSSQAAPSVEMVGCHTIPAELAGELLKLRQEIVRRGYRVDPAAAIGTCPMTHDSSSLVIDPFGDIYKCEAFVGRRQFSVGNVGDANLNYRDAEFTSLSPWRQDASGRCLKCAYLPMCGGGCRYIAQLKYSDYTRVVCDLDYFKKVFPKLLKMDFERGAL